MEIRPVVYREEALAMMGAMADIVVVLRQIKAILGGEDEALEEDDES